MYDCLPLGVVDVGWQQEFLNQDQGCPLRRRYAAWQHHCEQYFLSLRVVVNGLPQCAQGDPVDARAGQSIAIWGGASRPSTMACLTRVTNARSSGASVRRSTLLQLHHPVRMWRHGCVRLGRCRTYAPSAKRSIQNEGGQPTRGWGELARSAPSRSAAEKHDELEALSIEHVGMPLLPVHNSRINWATGQLFAFEIRPPITRS